MRELLDHPWVKVLLIASTVAMCSFALRETASITLPIASAFYSVLVPVAIGFVIAYVLTPVVDLISKRVGWGRTIATGALFGVTTLALVGGMVLLAPPLVREGAELANQAVRGEPFTDLDGNGQWDEGEPYTDLDRDNAWDPALFTRLAGWVEGRQRWLRELTHQEVDAGGMAFLGLYLAETEAARGDLARLLAPGARPAGPATAPAPAAWDPAWPGPAAAEVAAAIQRDPGLAPHLLLAGQALAQRHRELLVAARAGRSNVAPPPALAGLVARVREARPPTGGTLAETAAFLRRTAAEDREGRAAAHELMTVLRGGEAGVGARAVNAAVSKLEGAVRGQLDQAPDRLAGWVGRSLADFSRLGEFLLNALLIPIYAFFLVLAMPAIRSGVKELIPATHRDSTLRIVREIERAVSAFFRGRLIICTACAALGVAGFLIIGLLGTKVPYGVLFGVAIGVATALPLAGLLFLVPAVVLALIQPGAGPVDIALVVSVYVAIQSLEAVLIPIILGREVELHPVWLIIALLLCGKLLGVLGLILAVPIAATVRILGREFLWPRLKAWAARGVEAVQPPPPSP